MPELATTLPLLLFWAVAGYLLGSIPFGIVVARALGLGDLRLIGSGNIGATNVLRTGSKLGAALTLIGDAGKAAFAVLLGRWLAGEDAGQIAGLAAFVGHCYPVWLGFRGGKGVATWFGLLLVLTPLMFVVSGAIWLIVAAVTRYSSLAALMAAGWLPVVVALTGRGELFYLTCALAVLIYVRHWPNIRLLRAGTERRIGGSKG